jgi:hypothetical protein
MDAPNEGFIPQTKTYDIKLPALNKTSAQSISGRATSAFTKLLGWQDAKSERMIALSHSGNKLAGSKEQPSHAPWATSLAQRKRAESSSNPKMVGGHAFDIAHSALMRSCAS